MSRCPLLEYKQRICWRSIRQIKPEVKERFILQAPSKYSCFWDQLEHLLRIFSRRWCLSATPSCFWGRPSSRLLLDPDPLRVFLTKWGEGRNMFLHPQELSQSSHTKVWPERMVGVCTSINTIRESWNHKNLHKTLKIISPMSSKEPGR